MLKYFHWRALILLITLFIGTSFQVSANTINNIRVWPSPHDTRVVMDMASEPTFSYFSLSKPDRLVVDIKNTKLKASLPINVKDSQVLTKIRKSNPPESSSYRLVFEMKKDVEVNVFKLAPTADGQYSHRLVIDFAHDDSSEAATSKASSSTSKASTAAAPSIPTTVASTTRKPTNIVVAIDPGHGGEDPGSIGPARNYEKNITLAISKKVAAKLNATSNIKAVLTRTGDYYVNLNKRSEIARKNKALLLVSIHADSYTTSGPRGASVFVLSTRRANTEIARWVVKKEEQSELLGGGGVLLAKNSNDRNVSQTVLDLQFSHSQTEGNKLALNVIDELKQVTHMHKSKPVYASLAVLKSPDIPSILVETGFISNPAEEKLLIENYHQNRLADGIANAIKQYFKENPPEGMIMVSHPAGSVHKVKSGESLSVIAQNYGTTTANLVKWNNLKSTSLAVGQELKVASSTASSNSAPAALSYHSSVVTHVVKSGDYLGKIAEQYGVSVSSIKSQNNLSSNTLKVGQKLNITVRSKVETTTYKVQRGDFLGKIADKFGVTVSQIRSANNLRSDSLAVGQKLIIPQS